MPRLDEPTLHKVRRMAAAGATSPHIAARLALPVEQVAFVCGRVTPGERESYGGLVPEITAVDECRTDPCLPFAAFHDSLRWSPVLRRPEDDRG